MSLAIERMVAVCHDMRTAGAALTIASLVAAVAGAGERQGPVLRWKAASGAVTYQLQIAKEPTFDSLVIDIRLEVAGYRWTQATDGTFYWRVRGIDADGRTGYWSASGSFVVGAPTAPRLVTPRDGARFTYTSDQQRLTLVFTKSEGATSYEVEVASDPSFRRILMRKRRTDTELSLAYPGLGVFYWRASSTDAGGRSSAPSDVRRFSVELGMPRLVEPKQAQVEMAAVRFRWRALEHVAQWRVSVAPDAGDLFQRIVHGSTLIYEPPRPGHYRWEVQAWGARGPVGKPARGAFEVSVPTASVVKPIDGHRFQDMPAVVEMAWTPVLRAEGYTVEVSTDASFETSTRTCAATTPACTLEALREGMHHWRVFAHYGQDKRVITDAARFFLPAQQERLVAPTLLAPSPRAVLSLSGNQGTVELRWSPVEHAVAYDVAVAGLDELEQIDSNSISDTRLTLDKPTPGTYGWRVRAKTAETSGPWSDTSQFSVREVLHRSDEPAPWFEELELGVRIGWVTSFGRLSAVALGADASGQLSFLPELLRLSLRIGYFGGKAPIPQEAGLPAPIEQEWHIVPIGLAVICELPLQVVTLYGGGGPVAQVTFLSVGQESTVSARIGFGLVLGAAYRLGPGRLCGEVAGGASGLNHRLLELAPASLQVVLGYRFTL